MYGIENILVHDMDGQAHPFPNRGERIHQILERDRTLGNVHHHNLRKQVLQDGLGHFHNVDIIFCADGGNTGQNAHHILSNYSDNCTHC